MRCDKCGAAVAQEAVFCAECGSRLPDVAAPVNELSPAIAVAPLKNSKSCPYCGEQILDVALKCRFCGSDLMAIPPPQARSASNIVLNAPHPSTAMAAAGAPAWAPAPSIVIQNVQATQAPGFLPGHYKNPGLAAFLSVIFPGAGQFYNGHAGKGILILFTCWLIIPYVWGIFDAYSSAQRINRVGF